MIGWRRQSSQLGDVIEAVNQQQALPFVFDLQYDAPGHPEALFCRSDHYSYARYGIPIASISTGLHADYHQVTDEPQYLDYAKLTRVARFALDVVVEIANRGRLALSAPRPDPAGPCQQ